MLSVAQCTPAGTMSAVAMPTVAWYSPALAVVAQDPQAAAPGSQAAALGSQAVALGSQAAALGSQVATVLAPVFAFGDSRPSSDFAFGQAALLPLDGTAPHFVPELPADEAPTLVLDAVGFPM
ncbi:hypothetical protein EOD39_18864 [Acipenser ruthenus]|uniref:Uncharacterized protein n=1 Tax=Acipenser ruthenus TaxID=7906 RepID=A0A444UZV4_ACIRT|nr:hypothetical protein EOD39_18864 [Acipenser ruthenus]